MEKTLYLMRHGETLFNQQKKIQGWCDSPLTEKGMNQAKIAAEYFSDNEITFDSAYASTSERACDTLELITDMPYKRVKGLKEWNFGTFEAEHEYLNPQLPYRDFFVAYGGEEEMQLRKRVSDTLLKIMQEEKGNTYWLFLMAPPAGNLCEPGVIPVKLTSKAEWLTAVF
ncbi:hypothetical protein GCM10008931_35480 [Oceanobacillus oncorhynchi subsp. oncorhynchi]